MSTWLRIGTRGSKLALIQAGQLKTALESTGVQTEIITHTTSGDRDTESPIYRMSKVGVFVEELNSLVERGDFDIAVHSAKDIPSAIPDSLEVAAVLPRASFNDVLVADSSLESLEKGSVIGTSSKRRISELRALRNDLVVKDIRGNIGTRIGKLKSGEYNGIILAKAALERMGEDVKLKHYTLSEKDFVPAPNQGIIAVVSRKGSKESEIVRRVNHTPTYTSFTFERELVSELRLGCSMPAGILCVEDSGVYRLTARFYSLLSDEYREYLRDVNSVAEVGILAEEIRDTLPKRFGYGFGV
ncbi:hypothetical protein IX51_00145 [uncultured archaeon]|nr:hypothetical protein IX51_00145 [uncultured archaeon]HKJ96823.1 hydroxymethylbilane synthase [Thermoplasmataceae archaeon]